MLEAVSLNGDFRYAVTGQQGLVVTKDVAVTEELFAEALRARNRLETPIFASFLGVSRPKRGRKRRVPSSRSTVCGPRTSTTTWSRSIRSPGASCKSPRAVRPWLGGVFRLRRAISVLHSCFRTAPRPSKARRWSGSARMTSCLTSG